MYRTSSSAIKGEKKEILVYCWKSAVVEVS